MTVSAGGAPARGVDPAGIEYRVHAHAFNALTRALPAGLFMILSDRQAVADAIVDAIEPLIRVDERAAAKRAVLGELIISTCEIDGHAPHAARITVDYGLQVTSFCLPPEHAAFLGDALASKTQAATRERESIALQMEGLAANYPESAFPASSESRDAISGAAMRYAYLTAARLIREREAG